MFFFFGGGEFCFVEELCVCFFSLVKQKSCFVLLHPFASNTKGRCRTPPLKRSAPQTWDVSGNKKLGKECYGFNGEMGENKQWINPSKDSRDLESSSLWGKGPNDRLLQDLFFMAKWFKQIATICLMMCKASWWTNAVTFKFPKDLGWRTMAMMSHSTWSTALSARATEIDRTPSLPLAPRGVAGAA